MNDRTAKTSKTAKNNRSHAFAVLEVFVVPRDATIYIARLCGAGQSHAFSARSITSGNLEVLTAFWTAKQHNSHFSL